MCEDYRDSLGTYWVCLERTSLQGIKDTICKRISSYFKFVTYVGPYFNPDSKDSSAAKVFNLRIDGESLYDLAVYSRWGIKVFESKNKDYNWNGRMFNTGEPCPDGTYYYILNYRLMGKDENDPVLNGTIRIIR